MSALHSIVLTCVVVLVPVASSAQTVYRSTDEQGVVEFSDQPNGGSSEVTVDPNVVKAAPVPEIETSQQAGKTQAATASEPAQETEEHTEYTTVNTNHNRARRKRRARVK